MTIVAATPLAPPVTGLVVSSRTPPAGEQGWERGLQFAPECPGGWRVLDPCDDNPTEYGTPADSGAIVDYQPFGIEALYTCSTRQFDPAEAYPLVLRRLKVLAPTAIAREFWTGDSGLRGGLPVDTEITNGFGDGAHALNISAPTIVGPFGPVTVSAGNPAYTIVSAGGTATPDLTIDVQWSDNGTTWTTADTHAGLGDDPINLSNGIDSHTWYRLRLTWASSTPDTITFAGNQLVYTGTGHTRNQHLASGQFGTVTVLNSGTALDLLPALALLEDSLGECLSGQQGMIHMTRGVAVRYQALQSVIAAGNLRQTVNGTILVADAGYPGTDPDGDAPSAGKAWLYATGRTTVRQSQPWGPEQLGGAVGEIDRATNTRTARAQMVAAVTHDGCCLLAVQVNL